MLKTKGSRVIESRRIRYDNTTFPVEINSTFIHQEKQDFILSVSRDLTQRREEANKLLESYKHVGVINSKIELLCELIKYEVKEKNSTIKHDLMPMI